MGLSSATSDLSSQIRPKSFLITRSAPSAQIFAEKLTAKAWKPIVSPLIKVTYHPSNIHINTLQCVIITSRHALEAASVFIDVPLAVIGEATAALAREKGLTVNYTAETAIELFQLLQSELSGTNGNLLYLRGRDISVSISDHLTGFNITQIVTYSALAQPLSAEALAVFRDPTPFYISFHSLRTAKLFLEEIKKHGLENQCANATACCLSATIVEPLKPLNWQQIIISKAPNDSSLIEAIEASL